MHITICPITGKETKSKGNAWRADRRINGRDVTVKVAIEVDGESGPSPDLSDEGMLIALDRAFINPPVEAAAPAVTDAPADAPLPNTSLPGKGNKPK